MSRVAKKPISVPSGVDVTIEGQSITVKGSKGTLEHRVHDAVEVVRDEGALRCSARENAVNGMAFAGTTRAVINNMVTGVSEGFERRLQLVGVGYRAQMQGNALSLALGFSHPVKFEAPDGVSVETPTQTEIVLRGVDKQKVGQAAAEIRAFRPPEPYKGKGVKYDDELIQRKEAKKK
ncbi:MAG: 50S ribosomal protein L6 [Gammaproteobacteria bacterium]|jgi:large subunit ribosomal protein L6|nr:50S ribosomal protein L6 [Gammaproteobacteria bacterium]MDX2459169.1 50S ribosomal protein L6 [Gammaproteobacteria bacterium]